jgi:hypothetical protein
MTTKITVQAHVGSQFSQVTVPIPTLKYLNNFIRLNKSAGDMLATGVFPNAKEITESFAAHNAVMRKLGCSVEMLKRLNPIIVVIGDGSTPRTGATFAFKSPFHVISIDPNLNWIDYDRKVDRLTCYRETLRDFCSSPRTGYIPLFANKDPVILVNVHGHVPSAELKQFYKLVGDRLFAVVEIPCCYPQYSIDAFGEPTIEYIDWGIHSEKRIVRIWKFKKEQTTC